jgi:hypothetical protein
MSSETHEFAAATSIGQMTKLFVCYHAVTALAERFCQNASAKMPKFARPCRLAPSPSRRAPPNPTVELDRSNWLAAKLDPQVASPALGRHRLGISTLRCDHCRRELGCGVHRYWGMQFCSSACMTAYQQRLAPETRVKISRLDVLPSEDQISGSNLSQRRVSWPALWVFYPIILIGLSSMRNEDSKNTRQRRSAQAALESFQL